MAPLLFLTQRIPYPPTKGEKIRALQILKHLAGSYDVHLGCLIDDPRDFEHVPVLRAMCRTSHFEPLDRRRAKITCLGGLLTGEPLSVTFYRRRGLARWVRRVFDEVNPAVVVVCSSNMAPYILDFRSEGQLCLVDLMDVDSEKWRAYAETGKFPMKWVHAREWRLMAELEARIAGECDWSTFVSEEEAALFRSQQPRWAARIRAVGNGVDAVYFDPDQRFEPPFATEKPNFVFTGTMDYPPNVDAVTWFARAILPIIREAEPAAQFHVVGSSPSTAVQELTSIEGVFVTGRVPDVRPYIAHATAAVAPMRIARGIQNKVLEAMSMARPVVVTREALEGIAAVEGAEVLVAEGPADFAARCLATVREAPEAAAVGAAARRRVTSDFVWAAKLRGFDRLLAEPASR